VCATLQLTADFASGVVTPNQLRCARATMLDCQGSQLFALLLDG
jgi:hypothetical protein